MDRTMWIVLGFPQEHKLGCRREGWDQIKNRRTVWMVLALILMIGVVWNLTPVKEEARYEGKTVKEWFDSIPVKMTFTNASSGPYQPELPNAIKAMKREALPFLYHEIQKVDSKSHNWLFSRLNRLSSGRIMSDDERRTRIFTCFWVLGPDDEDAVNELILISRTAKPDSAARIILQMVRPGALSRSGIK